MVWVGGRVWVRFLIQLICTSCQGKKKMAKSVALLFLPDSLLHPGPLLAAKTGPGGLVLVRTTFRMTPLAQVI